MTSILSTEVRAVRLSRRLVVSWPFAAGFAAVALVAIGLGFSADASGSPQIDCQPLPNAHLGTYRKARNVKLRLILGACTFEARGEQNPPEGAGEYTVSSGDADQGEIVLSNDASCRGPGQQDLPTPYSYEFDHDAMTLGVVGGTAADLCTGRPENLTGLFVKAINGNARIAYDPARTPRTFVVTGSVKDRGKVAVRSTRRGKKFTVRVVALAGRKGTITIREKIPRYGRASWAVTAGTRSYSVLHGTGRKIARKRAGGRWQALLTGTLSNG